MTDLTSADQELRQLISDGKSGRLLIIGGGITGAATFAKAAAAGFEPWLIEQNDFTSGTSSRSSKMLHGGLRYLAQGDIAIVRESAREINWFRQHLPQHVKPLAYVFIHQPGKVPSPWLFDKVLSGYDLLTHNKRHHRLTQSEIKLLLPQLTKHDFDANLFYDSITDDCALVLSLLQTGVKYGGLCANYLKVTKVQRPDSTSIVTLTDTINGTSEQIECDFVINATGAWAGQLHPPKQATIKPVRGSHITLPFWKIPTAGSIAFSHPQDGRPVYIYPWAGVTVVGCTELVHQPSLDQCPTISLAEQQYLLAAVNHLDWQHTFSSDDIIATWAGVRPIISKSTDLSDLNHEPRKHQIWQQPGMISIAGGKLVSAMPMANDILTAAAKQQSWVFNPNQQIELSCFVPPNSPKLLRDVISSSAIKNLGDLLLRRSRLGLTMGVALKQHQTSIAQLCQQYLHWSEQKFEQQWQQYWQHWQQSYSSAVSLDQQNQATLSEPAGDNDLIQKTTHAAPQQSDIPQLNH